MKFNKILYTLFFINLAGLLSAQTYNFETISLENGLPQAQVTCLKEDTRGYLWIGTQGGGVACFDGVKFKVYDEFAGIAGNIITAIDEDLNGHIWIGTTYGGVTRFDGRSFFNLTKENGLLENNVTAITVDKKNKVYIATTEGLNTVENKTVSILKTEFIHTKSIKKVLRDTQGKLWFLAGDEVYLYNNYEWVNINNLFRIKQAVNAIAQDKSGNLWLSVKGEGLFILSKKNNDSYQIIPYQKNNELKNIDIQHVIFDNHNNIWICTNGAGIAKFDGKKLQFFNRANGFKADAVTTVCEDRSGNIWFGTNGEGIIKYNPSPFVYYDNVPGFDASNIFGIMTDKANNLWVSPNGTEVIKYNEKNTTKFNSKNGLSIRGARVIAQDKHGVVWVGGTNGLFSINNNAAKKYSLLPDSASVRSILFDKNNNMWIGTNGQGLYCFQEKNSIHYSQQNGLTHNYIHALYQDTRGIIWIGTGFGLNYIQNGKIGNYRAVKEFCNDYIGSITEDRQGNMYFGTDRCVVQYNRSKFKAYSQADGLASSTIYSLITDNLGNVWVGTNRGVDKLNISSKGEIVRIKNYSYQEGFKGIECNTRAVTKDRAGNLFFATIKGIIEYVPSNDISIETKPTMHITGIDAFSKPFDFEKNGYTTTGWFHLPIEPTLDYDNNYLTFKFIGINMYAAPKIKYQYMLVGLNTQWLKTNEPQVTYTNLKPGHYVFKVKAYADSQFNYTLTQYSFNIATPFWKTAWFYFLILILIVIAVYWFIQYRIKFTQLKNKKLEHHVSMRTTEILKQKQEIEYLFKEVHHRVKNNLQVINSLLNLQKFYIEDKKMLDIFQDCQNRIYTMSVIHEKLYENNALSSINFNEYIKNLIKQLVDTYQLDFPIKYHLEVDIDKLDLDTMIPVGLLINEIISNSLKYAFPSNQSNNVITFKMKKNEDQSYTMILGDNGVGSKVGLNDEHTTFGLELIKTLAEQLHGTINQLPVDGTMYEITFSPVK
ncbi:MAG TPA: two-component regulator propeller domain-containing protein [Bacteroidia bacterium]|nr:two-component regulator propeller domain-containing protein [Bacteroidia bacterium]